MKTFFSIIAILSVSIANATNYYFSASTGNDDRSAIEAQNKATPWASIDKFNALGTAFFKPGDTVFFKCGDVFFGSLMVRIKRPAGNTAPFVITSYGKGPKPVLTTMFRIKEWTPLGNNKYRSKAPLPRAFFEDGIMAMGAVNGRQQWPGSFPDYDPANPVGMSIQSPDGTTAFSLDECDLNQTNTDWTGAFMTLRSNPYLIERVRITKHIGRQLGHTPTSVKPGAGNSAWIIHDRRTLSADKEWFYDSTTQKVDVYLARPPASYTIEFPTADRAIDARGASFIHIIGIAVRGANRHGIYLYGAHEALVQDCDVSFCGSTAVYAATTNLRSPRIVACRLWDAGLIAIDVRGAKDFVIEGNDIRRIGIITIIGADRGNERSAVYANQSANTINRITANKVDSCGYNGFRFYGSRNLIERNLVMNTGLVAGDGGAVYCRGSVSTTFSGNRITKNIFFNAKSAAKGVKSGGRNELIYLDDNTTGVEVDSNFAALASNSVLYAHNAQYLNIHHNTFFGAGGQVVRMKNDNGSAVTRPMRAITFQNNLVIGRTDEYLYELYTHVIDSADFRLFDQPAGALAKSGGHNWRNNTLRQPMLQKSKQFWLVYGYNNNALNKTMSRSLAQVQRAFELDEATDAASPKYFAATANPDDVYRIVYNPNGYDSTVTLQKQYINIRTGEVYNTGTKLKIAAHSGMVLLTAQSKDAAMRKATYADVAKGVL